MKVTNIFNYYNDIYIFNRQDDYLLQIIKTSVKPYCFILDKNGKFITYDGKRANKYFYYKTSEIYDSEDFYERDISLVKKYIIDEIKVFDKTKIKYLFFDIEVLADDFPDVEKANNMISCITVYNSQYDYLQSFWIKDYKDEKEMLEYFVNYIKTEKPDLLLAWNVMFDYKYLYYRYLKLFGKHFSVDISPIHLERYCEKDKFIYFPMGISILDYMLLFKKVYSRESSYSLDNISQKFLGEKGWKDTNFGELTNDVKDKNYNDVLRMVKLEDKLKLLVYFDEIRRYSKSQWEDLYYNSRIIEMLVLEEARKKRIVLPNKQLREKDTFQGALRNVEKKGVMFNVGKYDLSGAYPSVIIDFCLDSMNITDDSTKGIFIDGNYYIQNKNALLPSTVRKILKYKNETKKLKNNTPVNSPNYYEIKKIYEASKSITNSAYGVMGASTFRLYDKRVASATTFLVRDLLQYVINKLKEEGYSVVYYDTDSIMVETNEFLLEKMNNLIQQWAKEKYNKDKVNIKFDYEGTFENLVVIAMCRYRGKLINPDGETEIETKGLEIKRNDSSEFMKKFQKELLDLLSEGVNKEDVEQFIYKKMEEIKKVDLKDIAFPCKIQRKKYKNVPIFLRAYYNTKELINFDVKLAEKFYYVFVESDEIDKNGKIKNVLAFKDDWSHIKNIDWNEMIRRNILMKVETIYDAFGWDFDQTKFIKVKPKK